MVIGRRRRRAAEDTAKAENVKPETRIQSQWANLPATERALRDMGASAHPGIDPDFWFRPRDHVAGGGGFMISRVTVVAKQPRESSKPTRMYAPCSSTPAEMSGWVTSIRKARRLPSAV